MEETDPRRVLEMARAFQPDLVLPDLIMPELDGAEVAAQLEADWTLPRVPIVFLTALITLEEARHVRRIEGHRLVAKPVSTSELIRVVGKNFLSSAEAQLPNECFSVPARRTPACRDAQPDSCTKSAPLCRLGISRQETSSFTSAQGQLDRYA